jgi:phosphoketolase
LEKSPQIFSSYESFVVVILGLLQFTFVLDFIVL